MSDKKVKEKLWETKLSMDTFFWLLDNIKNSPEVKYAKDTWQFDKKAEVDADNHIWPAREKVVYNLDRYKRSSPNWWDRWVNANSLDEAVAEYNKMLKKYWDKTSWWAMDDNWEFHWQDYTRYMDDKYNKPLQYSYTVEWEKSNAILNWWKYDKQDFKFNTKDWAILTKQINKLNDRYKELDNLQKKVRPKWNSLREQWKEDTEEAKQYLNKRAEYDNEKIEIINSIRKLENDYRDLVNNYK